MRHRNVVSTGSAEWSQPEHFQGALLVRPKPVVPIRNLLALVNHRRGDLCLPSAVVIPFHVGTDEHEVAPGFPQLQALVVVNDLIQQIGESRSIWELGLGVLGPLSPPTLDQRGVTDAVRIDIQNRLPYRV